MSIFFLSTLLRSRPIRAGNSNIIDKALKAQSKAACKARDRKAGIGMIAAATKAAILHNTGNMTETPVLFRTSPTFSCKIRKKEHF